MPGLICEPGLNWLLTTLGRPGLTGAGWKITTSDTESERGTDTGARAMEVMDVGKSVSLRRLLFQRFFTVIPLH